MRSCTTSELVDDLGIPHRCRSALFELKRRGSAIANEVLRGLRDPNPLARRLSCEYFDLFLVEAALEGLLSCIEDDDPGVRWQARHALTCERCKKNAWHPPAEATELAAASWTRETVRSSPR